MLKFEKDLLEAGLNDIITELLGGPTGDPDRSHLHCAAKAFILLQGLGLKVKNEERVEKGLREENGYGDFLAENDWPKKPG